MTETEIQEMESEVARLRAFAQAILDYHPEYDLGGLEILGAAAEHGLLEEVSDLCGETCYRRTELLTGGE